MLVTAARAQSITSYFGTDTFARAYRMDGEISFDPFQTLNWETKARAALPWLNLDRPTPAQIARLETFESAGPDFRSVKFHAPMDAAVRRESYLLIHDKGVVGISPDQLAGEVSFFFKQNMGGLDRKAVTGRVVAKPSSAVDSAAFVIVGKLGQVTEVRTAPLLRSGNSLELTEQGQGVRWIGEAGFEPEVRSAFTFRLAGKRYLLVRWKMDICEFSYSLFSVGTSLAPIAGNAYACDV